MADPESVVSETLAEPSTPKATSTEAAEEEEEEDDLEQGDNIETGTAEQGKQAIIPFNVDNPKQKEKAEEPPKKKKTSKPPTGGRAPQTRGSGKKIVVIPKAAINVIGTTVARGVVAPKLVHQKTLERLRIEEEVKEYFAGIGWIEFLSWNEKVYIEMANEFLEQFTIVGGGTEATGMVKFKLCGRMLTMTINEINQILGIEIIVSVHTEECL